MKRTWVKTLVACGEPWVAGLAKLEGGINFENFFGGLFWFRLMEWWWWLRVGLVCFAYCSLWHL